MGRLDGTVFYISGGAHKLGRALVARCIAEGARVGVLDISAPGNESLRQEFGAAVAPTVGDVRQFVSHERAVMTTLERFGRIDTYIACAAVWDGDVALGDLPAERISDAFHEVFGVNVKGALLGAKAAEPALRETAGSMIFTLSSAALHAGGGGALYTASEHAGVGLVRALAYDLAPHIRVNGVAPAAISIDRRGPDTLDLARPVMAGIDHATLRSGHPLDFFPSYDDNAAPYIFLAAKGESKTVSGIVLESDLGLNARGVSRTSRAGQRERGVTR